MQVSAIIEDGLSKVHALWSVLGGEFPVPIERVLEHHGWVLTASADLDPALAFAVIAPPIQALVVNAHQSGAWQRAGHAIAFAHCLQGHYGPLIIGAVRSAAVVAQSERLTLWLASRILIPETAIEQAASIEELARWCDVAEPLLYARLHTASIRHKQRLLFDAPSQWSVIDRHGTR